MRLTWAWLQTSTGNWIQANQLEPMKYIRHAEMGFVLFEEHIQHDAVAMMLGGPDKVISAGFVRDNGIGQIACYGESVTLRSSSREEDSEKIRNRLGVF